MSTHHPTFGRSSGFGNVFKSLTKSLKTSSSSSPSRPSSSNTSGSNVPVQINATVVGGSNDQQKLFLQLRSGPLPIRASTAAKMTESLDKYSISSIPEIWYLARDMCNPKIQSYIRRIAIKLLIQCINHDEMSVGNRLMYFKDIMTYCKLTDTKIDGEYDLFLKALRVLTGEGKDIHDFCIFDQDKNLIQFLLTSLNALGRIARDYDDNDDDATTEHNVSIEEKPEDVYKEDRSYQSLIKLIKFTKNCLKFNFTIIDESSVIQIISKVIDICYQTKNSSILINCMQLLNQVVIFGNIPIQNFSQAINVYCYLYGSLNNEELSSIVCEIINNLSLDNTFYLTLTNLCEIIQNPDLQSLKYTAEHNNANLVRSFTTSSTLTQYNSSYNKLEFTILLNSGIGAIQLMENIQIQSSKKSQTNFSCSFVTILKAYKTALSYNVPLINTTFLRSFDRLFSRDDQEASLPSFEKLFPFQFWYSSSFSIYEVLQELKLNTEQDISYWKSICLSLQSLYEDRVILSPKDKLVDLFLQNYPHLSPVNITFILDYYREEKLCSILNPMAKENCNRLLNYFYFNNITRESGHNPNSIIDTSYTNDATIRIETLSIIYDTYKISTTLFNKTTLIDDIIFEIFSKSTGEKDPLVVDYIVNELFTNIALKASLPFFQQLLSIHSQMLQYKPKQERLKSLVSMSSFGSGSQYSRTITSQPPSISGKSSEFINDSSSVTPSVMTTFAKAIVKLFVITNTNDAAKAQELYTLIVNMCHFSLQVDNVEMTLILFRCLIRIRASSEKYIYLVKPSDMEGLSNTFGRNSLIDQVPQEDTEGKWKYPESFDYLPEEYFNKPSKKLQLFNPKDSKLVINSDEQKIDISRWLTIVLDIMENVYNWELYSFVWSHFCPQLSNMTLFLNNQEQVLKLRRVICDQLCLNLPSKLILPPSNGTSNNITKGDLQVAFVRTLSGLLGYHDFFSKHDEDQIVSSLIFGLGSWDKTAIPCVHILTICCYEIPLSIKKYLSVILAKLQTRVTSSKTSAHTLEFLIALIHLPSMTANFTIDEFKRVFAITFKYIQYLNDMKYHQKANGNAQQALPKYGSDLKVDQMVSTQSTENSATMNQYILTLSFTVIAAWYIKIDLNERKLISGFLVKNLILSNANPEELDENTIAVLDLIIRFTYSNLPVKNIVPSRNKSVTDNNVSTNTWILGYSIISLDTHMVTGDTMITIRRASGVNKFQLKLDESMIPEITTYDDSNSSNSQVILNGNFFLLQLFNSLDKEGRFKPLPLIEDAATMRALSSFDRIPIVDSHKVGILYIGPNQKDEIEVLANKSGSRDYQNFLEGIGQFIRLKGSRDIYVGGLDTENNVDGEYGIFWSDEISHLIFHTTTLMPNNANDKYFDLKKRHIGNNYVNIFFDESGLPFNFNLIKSQFNFLNIVISPNSVSFDRPLHTGNDGSKKFFKVKAYRREGVPGVFSTCHFKLVSEDQLPHFIRNLVLTSDDFANVWHATTQGSFVANWAHRVKQINILREKTKHNHQVLQEEQQQEQLKQQQQQHEHEQQLKLLQQSVDTTKATNDATLSFLEQLQPESLAAAHPTEAVGKYDYISPTDNDLYALLEFNSYT